MTNPVEEVTAAREDVIATIGAIYKSNKRRANNLRLSQAIDHISAMGNDQGYDTRAWLLHAEDVWFIAHLIDATDSYPDEPTHPAITAQATLRALLAKHAPFTCRSMAKQLELGEIQR